MLFNIPRVSPFNPIFRWRRSFATHGKEEAVQVGNNGWAMLLRFRPPTFPCNPSRPCSALISGFNRTSAPVNSVLDRCFSQEGSLLQSSTRAATRRAAHTPMILIMQYNGNVCRPSSRADTSGPAILSDLLTVRLSERCPERSNHFAPMLILPGRAVLSLGYIKPAGSIAPALERPASGSQSSSSVNVGG